MSRPLDVARVREQFPALARTQDGRPVVFFDGPAGSQVPRRVADAVSRYLLEMNANHGGAFATSVESDAMIGEARAAVADLLGSSDPDLVVFGPNMTTLTLSLARALTRTWNPGDEILVSRMEHDANFTPWVQAAADAGATVREVVVRVDDCTLDLGDLLRQLNARTRLVAVGAASNAVGTINPVRRICEAAHEVGAEVFVDAVHYAPHLAMDVEAWGCDYLACSPYKFFGPHMGVLWGKRERMDTLPVYKLRPPWDGLPDRWETGTQNHEGIAGTREAVEYLADLGREVSPGLVGRRESLVAAFAAIEAHERALVGRLLEGIAGIPALRVRGITDPARFDERVPTVAVTHERRTPQEIAKTLAERGLFVWDGNYYALPLTESLGVEPEGMVRIGLLHYNTQDEVDRLLDELRRLA